jgi:hypothetical protein
MKENSSWRCLSNNFNDMAAKAAFKESSRK